MEERSRQAGKERKVMKMQEQIQRIINDNPDSIEIGTPGKNGTIKVYGNYSDVDAFKKKIDNAVIVRSHAQEKLQ